MNLYLEERMKILEERMDKLEGITKEANEFRGDLYKIARIQSYIANQLGLRLDVMISKARPNHIVWPRMETVWICRTLFPHLSLQIIAEQFSKHDHGTVTHAMRRVNNRMQTDKTFHAQVMTLLAECDKLIKHESKEKVAGSVTSNGH